MIVKYRKLCTVHTLYCSKQTLKKLPLHKCSIVYFFFAHTAVQVGIESPSYLVAEDAGPVMVCATATGTLAQIVAVAFTTMDGSATGQSVFHACTLLNVLMCPVVHILCNHGQTHTLIHNVQMIYSGTPLVMYTYVEALTETFAPVYVLAAFLCRLVSLLGLS